MTTKIKYDLIRKDVQKNVFSSINVTTLLIVYFAKLNFLARGIKFLHTNVPPLNIKLQNKNTFKTIWYALDLYVATAVLEPKPAVLVLIVHICFSA